MCREKLREAMDAIAAGEPVPDGVFIHVSRTPTQADWDALDPNSWETSCRDCGCYYEGVFPPKGEALVTKCPDCGSERTNGLGSPAGGFSLAMRSDF